MNTTVKRLQHTIGSIVDAVNHSFILVLNIGIMEEAQGWQDGEADMAKVLVIHPFFDIKGGGEVLALRLIQALREGGYEVSLLTTGIDSDELEKLFNIRLDGVKVYAESFRLISFLDSISHGRLFRLRRLMAVDRLFKNKKDLIEEHDLVVETQTNMPSWVDISYIHFPAVYGTNREEGLLWAVYNFIVKQYAKRFNKAVPGRVLTNSKWTASMIYRAYHIIPDVVYPPIDIEYFLRASENTEREKMVVTTSRFTLEKRLESILDVASLMPDYTFVLIGSTYRHSKQVLDELNNKIRKLGLRNVIIETNLPREKQLEYYARAKYYLHPMFTEHFGIAVVEAMASGLIPIVYRDGGAWYDIVSGVHDMLGYTSISEAQSIIRTIESKPGLYEELRRKSIEVAKQFNYERFKTEILRQVDYAYTIKSIGRVK